MSYLQDSFLNFTHKTPKWFWRGWSCEMLLRAQRPRSCQGNFGCSAPSRITLMGKKMKTKMPYQIKIKELNTDSSMCSILLLMDLFLEEERHWAHTSPWDLMGCSHESWGRKLPDGLAWLFLKGSGNWNCLLRNGRNKCHLCLHTEKEGGSKELQVFQPHLHPCKSGEADNPGIPFQTHEGYKGCQEQSGWISKGHIVPDQAWWVPGEQGMVFIWHCLTQHTSG